MISVPHEAITSGPDVNWRHIDGPLMFWAGELHWLTWSERFSMWLGVQTLDQVAEKRWPHLAKSRRFLLAGAVT